MILIGLGTNLGDRAGALASARAALVAQGDIAFVAVSSIVETPALLPENAPPEWDISFLNQVVRVETDLTPEALLVRLKSIERAMGRQDRGRWGPREIDLDLLAYGAQCLDSVTLTLPHPQMQHRAFVMGPLAEIAPTWVHPVLGQSVAEIWSDLCVKGPFASV